MKQETLEEAIDRISKKNGYDIEGGKVADFVDGMVKGAKWQQEQWEENLKEAFSMGRLGKTDMSFKEWFEQYKNK